MRSFPLMIFAAGFGTRMGALTAERPKPLIPVAGRPLIDRALDLAREAGARPVAVNLHYRGDQLERHLAGQDLRLAWEREAILETGGGLKAALPLLGPGPVMTLNPDVVWAGPNPLSWLAGSWTGAAEGLLLVAPVERLLGRKGGADFAMDAEGRLTRARGAATGLVYLGAQIVEGAAVAAWPETVFSMNRVWDAMIATGRLRGVVYPGLWCDVGSPEGLAEAEALLERQDG